MKSLSAKANKTDLEFLAKLLEKGRIKPVIDRRYSLDKTSEAMNYLSQGHSSGKVLVILESK
jgi:NADPH:quinone reductase-like Zn-dependent oxidoreductase